MEIINVEQGTPEWHEWRALRMTASHAQAIASGGKGLDTYILEMMAAYYSTAEKPSFSNSDMERGIELEPIAAMLYEFETGRKPEVVGFITEGDYIGVSPDRFVGDDGMMEIKCPSDKVYMKFLLDRKIDSKYMWQMQMQMQISGRKWNDYTVHNPNFEESIVITRVLPDQEKFDKLTEGYKIGIKKIKEIMEKMK